MDTYITENKINIAFCASHTDQNDCDALLRSKGYKTDYPSDRMFDDHTDYTEINFITKKTEQTFTTEDMDYFYYVYYKETLLNLIETVEQLEGKFQFIYFGEMGSFAWNFKCVFRHLLGNTTDVIILVTYRGTYYMITEKGVTKIEHSEV